MIKQSNLEILENITVIRDQMDFAIRESVIGLKKMVIFDMDNTILTKSFISTLAEKFGFKKELITIVTENSNPYTRTKLIARLVKGLNLKDLLETADSIPVAEYFTEIVELFKEKEYICGIISDSYDCITNHLVNKYGLAFSIANELEFSASIVTGEVRIPSFFIKTKESKCNHDFCKSNAMREVAHRYNIDIKNIITIGDSESDICMIKESGIGIAFCSANETLNLIADRIISDRTFRPLVDFI
jgi:HAD superfamily phosphoserine phosphatase-like hydrolase